MDRRTRRAGAGLRPGRRGLVDEHGHRQSLWLAEAGYSSYRRPDGFVSDMYRARFAHEHTAAYQAAFLAKLFTLALSTGDVDVIAWYRVNDLVAGQAVIGDVNNRHLGLRTAAGADKPAAAAFAFLARLFRGPIAPIDDRVIVVRTIGSDSEVHAFFRADGAVVVAGWLRTFEPGEVPPRQKGGGSRADPRVETVDVVVPIDVGATSVPVLDHTGRRVGRLPVARDRRRNGSRVTGMQLRSDAVTVIELRPRR